MRFEFDLKLGDRVIRMAGEAATPAEVFQKLAFWDSLPKEGPGGEGDLEFSYRTPQGFEYYAIVCPSAGMEFKFGQLKDEKGHLFPKAWEPLLRGADDHHEEAEPEKNASGRERRGEEGAKKQGGPAPAQGSKPGSAGDLKQSESVNMDARAERLVAENRVTKTASGYAVKVNDKVTYEVWRNEAGRVVCQCDRFDQNQDADPAFRCEHIRAVALFAKPRRVAA